MKILIIMIIILRHLSLLQPDTGIRPDLPPSPQVKKTKSTLCDKQKYFFDYFTNFPPKHEALAHLVYSQGPF